MPGSSRLNQVTPPTASGSQERSCATAANPACCVEMGRSRKYCFPFDVKDLARGRIGEAQGPALTSAVMSSGVFS